MNGNALFVRHNGRSEAARCVNTERPLAHLIDISDRQDEMKTTCSVDGCDRAARARGWCQGHYMRWYKTGDAGSGPLDARRERGSHVPCSAGGCDKDVRGLGLCSGHLQRLKKHGDPLAPRKRRVPPPKGEGSYAWKGDACGYSAAHVRVKVLRGSASQHQCSHCGRAAEQWAYDHLDPSELFAEKSGPYSPDPTHYMPLCAPCHKRFDNSQRAASRLMQED